MSTFSALLFHSEYIQCNTIWQWVHFSVLEFNCEYIPCITIWQWVHSVCYYVLHMYVCEQDQCNLTCIILDSTHSSKTTAVLSKTMCPAIPNESQWEKAQECTISNNTLSVVPLKAPQECFLFHLLKSDSHVRWLRIVKHSNNLALYRPLKVDSCSAFVQKNGVIIVFIYTSVTTKKAAINLCSLKQALSTIEIKHNCTVLLKKPGVGKKLIHVWG